MPRPHISPRADFMFYFDGPISAKAVDQILACGLSLEDWTADYLCVRGTEDQAAEARKTRGVRRVEQLPPLGHISADA